MSSFSLALVFSSFVKHVSGAFTLASIPSNLLQYISIDLMMALWLLDNANGNPYSIWVKEGRPDFPNLEHQKAMREQEVGIARDTDMVNICSEFKVNWYTFRGSNSSVSSFSSSYLLLLE